MKKLMVLMIACFTLLAGCGNDADGEQVQADGGGGDLRQDTPVDNEA